MTLEIAKKWAVVEGDEILVSAETRSDLEEKIEDIDLPANSEIVALPKPERNLLF